MKKKTTKPSRKEIKLAEEKKNNTTPSKNQLASKLTEVKYEPKRPFDVHLN